MSDIIEGRNPVLEALKSGRPINKILLATTIQRHGVIGDIIHLARERSIPVDYTERQFLDKESISGDSQGVVAYAAAKDYIELDELLAISKEKNEPAFYVILDGIEDPQNLGAILRTAEATGVHGVVVRERRAVGLTSAVARASAGAVEYVPVARVVNISQAIETLKKNNVWVIGVTQPAKAEYTRIDFKVPTAIVIGSEGKGLSPLVSKNCDALSYIPMKGKISSLNASIAAALVMYEVVRQRSAPPSKA